MSSTSGASRSRLIVTRWSSGDEIDSGATSWTGQGLVIVSADCQYGVDGVRSNVLAPGFVLTEGTREIFDDAGIERFADASAAGRLCTPEDVDQDISQPEIW